MVTRVEIRGYKSLNGFTVDLEPIAVIVGPNASGKSNVLDALQLLAGFVTEGTLARAFETLKPLIAGRFWSRAPTDQRGWKAFGMAPKSSCVSRLMSSSRTQ